MKHFFADNKLQIDQIKRKLLKIIGKIQKAIVYFKKEIFTSKRP